jgi:hypothetical protein
MKRHAGMLLVVARRGAAFATRQGRWAAQDSAGTTSLASGCLQGSVKLRAFGRLGVLPRQDLAREGQICQQR